MARDFNGASDWLTIGDLPLIKLTGTGPLTLASWAKPDTVNVNHPLLQKGTSVSIQYQIGISTAGKPLWQLGDGGANDVCTGATTLPVGVWSHICGRRIGAVMDVLLNGVIDGTVASSRSMQNGTDALRIASRGGSQTYMDGPQGEVALWDVGLTTEEVLALAKGVSPLMIRAANLRGYWPVYGISPEPDYSPSHYPAALSGVAPLANHCPASLPAFAFA